MLIILRQIGTVSRCEAGLTRPHFFLPMICGRFSNELEVGGDMQLWCDLLLIAPIMPRHILVGAFKSGTHPVKLCACKQGVPLANLEPAAEQTGTG